MQIVYNMEYTRTKKKINIADLNAGAVDAIVEINALYNVLSDITRFIASGFLVELKNKIYIVTSAHLVLHSTVSDPMTTLSCGISNLNGVIGNNRGFYLKIVLVDAIADFALCKITGTYDEKPIVGKHVTLKFADNLKRT